MEDIASGMARTTRKMPRLNLGIILSECGRSEVDWARRNYFAGEKRRMVADAGVRSRNTSGKGSLRKQSEKERGITGALLEVNGR